MSDTPICDFVRQYADSDAVRLHMPGHKGKPVLGCEARDITEIPGADVLYHARGVIRESEEIAARIFGSARTLYSTEGSSLCIRAMLQLAQQYARLRGVRPLIAAGRNAHRVFLEGAALLDLPIRWVGCGEELLRAEPVLSELEALFAGEEKPTAVYLTSPDYLGNEIELRPIADLCHANGALLLVDNAHGAYLRFLEPTRHPMDEEADLCCDSAHKTLPALTGCAYLHLSRNCPQELLPMAEQAMALFASTSPSYLLLQSLDALNARLMDEYPECIRATALQAEACRAALTAAGWALCGTEPLKLTLLPKARGYTGEELADILTDAGFVPEFADPDHLVCMLTPETTERELRSLTDFLLALPARALISDRPPRRHPAEQVLTPREALLSPFETVPAERAPGRILASPCVGCPPAVPIAICGERLDENALALFRYYGITELAVVR